MQQCPSTCPGSAQRNRAHRRLIGRDLDRRDLGHADGSLEEPAGGLGVAPRGDKHIDDLPELVDRSIDVAPLSGNLHVRLVHLPAISHAMPAGPGGVDQQRREPQHPPLDRDVVNLDPALGEEFFDVAVGQVVAQVPATATTMTSGGKRQPEKADRVAGAGRGRRVLIPAVSLPGRGRRGCNGAFSFLRGLRPVPVVIGRHTARHERGASETLPSFRSISDQASERPRGACRDLAVVGCSLGPGGSHAYQHSG